MANLEVWLVVDEAGDYAVGEDESLAEDAFNENIGSAGARRKVKLNVKIALPEAIAVDVSVPAEAGEVSVTPE